MDEMDNVCTWVCGNKAEMLPTRVFALHTSLSVSLSHGIVRKLPNLHTPPQQTEVVEFVWEQNSLFHFGK